MSLLMRLVLGVIAVAVVVLVTWVIVFQFLYTGN
jgi:hypothetical protein